MGAILLMPGGGGHNHVHCEHPALVQLGQAAGLYRATPWLAALQCPIGHTKAFATLALAAAGFVSSRILAGEGIRYMLPDASELHSLVHACAENALESECPMLSDASWLAIIVLLTCPAYPREDRVSLLHSASCQQRVLQGILMGNVIELDSDSATSDRTTALS